MSQVHPTDLALTVEQVGAVLRDDYDLRDPSLATALHRATGGWPALVQVSAETLAREHRSAPVTARRAGPTPHRAVHRGVGVPAR